MVGTPAKRGTHACLKLAAVSQLHLVIARQECELSGTGF